MTRRHGWLLILVALAALGGCAPKGVQSPIERAPPSEIAQARSLVQAGESDGATRAYENFIAAHPGTVEADLAELELGILEASTAGCAQAMPYFDEARASPDPALSLRATLRVASCELELHDVDQALTTLQPIAAERFTASDQELLWRTAVGASEQTLDAPLGMEVMDALFAEGGAAPDPERALAAVDGLAARLSVEQTDALFESLRPGGVPQIAVAKRSLEEGLSAQDADRIAKSTETLRQSSAIDDPEVRAMVARGDEFLHGNPFVVGALLPLSGRGREVGSQLLEGMQLAALHEGGPELVVEDTGSDPGRTATAAAALVGDARVVAILGPVGTGSIAAAADAAQRSGTPLVTFSVSDEVTEGGEEVFRFLYTPREEVHALVRTANRRGASRYAVLYPDQGYGRMMRRIFDEEVLAIGGESCEGIPYPPGTRSFVEYVQKLLDQGCDTVLLADVPDRVASIAPTFAAEGAWSTAEGPLPENAERRIRLLIPSPGWSPTLIAQAGRYLQGALVIAPFHPGSQRPDNVEFRRAYEERYGRAPESFSAYGYDAYRLVSATLRQGYQTRRDLREALASDLGFSSITAIDGFSQNRSPARAPIVYELRGQSLVREN